jgi:ADP-heptose:LPS heptosyltransferase
MRVLIIRCGALGDLVYATSVIDAMKLQYGENTIIDFVCTPGSGTLFKHDYRVHRVFPLKHKKIPILLSSQKKLIIAHSKVEPYDLLINFEQGNQFQTLVNSIKAKKKIGALLEPLLFPKSTIHMVDITKYMFKNSVSKDIFEKSHPKVIGVNRESVYKKYNLEKKYLIISPSNSHQKRKKLNHRAWVDKYWIDLIEILAKEIQVVIIGNQNEDAFFNKLKPYPVNVLDLVAQTDLSYLIGVIENASALIATDTGTAHLASAVNTEVFALIGPTPADVTGPYQSPFNKVHIISSNKKCAPCYKTEVMKNCHDNLCMTEITPLKVYETISSANIL